MARPAACVALALLACRPPAAAPTRPPPTTSMFLLTPDQLYTQAPIGDGVSFVPVVEKSIDRRAGAVEVRIGFVEVELPDEQARAELSQQIRALGEVETWTEATGEDLEGRVAVTCEAPLATTELVSVVCRVLDATTKTPSRPDAAKVASKPEAKSRIEAKSRSDTNDAKSRSDTNDAKSRPDASAEVKTRPDAPADAKTPTEVPTAATVRARNFAVDPRLRPVALASLLRPGVTSAELLRAALEVADEPVREAWRAGECSADPGWSLGLDGLTFWPDTAGLPCAPLLVSPELLLSAAVPNGLLARVLRVATGVTAEPEPGVEAAEDAPPAE